MKSRSALTLILSLWMTSRVMGYTQPFDYRAASPVIIRPRAPLLPIQEAVLERRDYCGGMYCDCPNECVDDDTCTTNAALLPCPVDGGGTCEVGQQACPDGTGCCGIDELCNDAQNTCLGCAVGYTICGDRCCKSGTACSAECQGFDGEDFDSTTLLGASSSTSTSTSTSAKSSGLGIASSTAASSTKATSTTSGSVAGSSTGASNSAASSPKASGSAVILKDSVWKRLTIAVLGWIMFFF